MYSLSCRKCIDINETSSTVPHVTPLLAATMGKWSATYVQFALPENAATSMRRLQLIPHVTPLLAALLETCISAPKSVQTDHSNQSSTVPHVTPLLTAPMEKWSATRVQLVLPEMHRHQ